MKVIYPGTFDPITLGHIDLIKRAKLMFDHVTVAISTGNDKISLFTEEERLKITSQVLKNFPGIFVTRFYGLIADFFENSDADAVIRGLRFSSDFNYENQMANINSHLNKKFETIFLMSNKKYYYLSSSIIRQIVKINPQRVSDFVDPIVFKAIINKIKQQS